ncbi:KpsF/GutQ family protein [Amylibacter kogurei]|uniref:KpsF/GutQ family protein n=1 Tax=Paramylibacter kogurei TaxID=1889778 RepID=A0A2G5K2U4_9RHOB|nr:KpsF/GutQ family sugar-phosphate isomerase [Amylibacter kogurei]PIB23439.1 KpsF/GutQ family protein [Amylibacter kogurei]
MSDTINHIRNAITNNISGLEQFQSALDDTTLAKSIAASLDLIYNMKGRLIVAGMGKSGQIARKLASTFASTGTPSYFVHPAEASHGDLGMIHGDDVLLLLSWSGETQELSDILEYSKRYYVPMIALTASKNSTLADKSDIAIVLPKVTESCPHNLAPTTSALVQLAVGDAMAVTLLRMKGFSTAAFREFHPGGKLGAVLTPVGEIMHTRDTLPLCDQSAPIIDVLGKSSEKSFGVVGLTDDAGALVGIITDGDIRRYITTKSEGSMKQAMWETQAHEIMTRGSICFTSDQLSAHALYVLQENKISTAFVLDGGKPVGLITMLQLLSAGVA